MREWALKVLRCLECGATPLEAGAAALSCPRCGASYPIRQGVVDSLSDPHPIVARERSAVQELDRASGEPAGETAALLGRFASGELSPEELAGSSYLRAISEARSRVVELLDKTRLAPGSLVLELGADHCLVSGLLLDAGCRVIALDITDHLLLAPCADSPDLCRVNADMNRAPLAAGAVDVVWATACAHHSWDLRRTFSETARVLKPGGRAIFCDEPMPSLLRYPFGFGFGKAERKLGINETWIGRSTWLRHCRGAGLRPRIVFPTLDRRMLVERLRAHHLPGFVAAAVGPLLPWLQVSVHLIAEKPGGAAH